MVKHSIIICLVLAVFSLRGQDTVKHYAFGTLGEENPTKSILVGNKVYLFGSTGNFGAGESQLYIVKATQKIDDISFHRIGGALAEMLLDVSFNENDSCFYLTSCFYDGFSQISSYGIRIYKLNLLLETIITVDVNSQKSEYPTFIKTIDNQLYLVYSNADDSDGKYYLRRYNTELDFINQFTIDVGFPFTPCDMISFNGLRILGTGFENDSAYSNAVLLNFQDDGTLIDYYSYGSQYEEIAKKIIWKYDTSWLILGSTRGYRGHLHDFDGFAMETDTNGQLHWTEILGNLSDTFNTDDFAEDIELSPKGKIAVGMTTFSFGQGESDFHLYELNNVSGDYEHGNSFGLENTEKLKNINCLTDSTYFLFGSTNSMGSGNKDLFLVSVSDALAGKPKLFLTIEDSFNVNSIGIDQPEVENCLPLPNVKWNCAPSILNIEVFDVGGQLVKSFILDSNNYSFAYMDSLGIPTGIYIIKITGNDQIKVLRLFLK